MSYHRPSPSSPTWQRSPRPALRASGSSPVPGSRPPLRASGPRVSPAEPRSGYIFSCTACPDPQQSLIIHPYPTLIEPMYCIRCGGILSLLGSTSEFFERERERRAFAGRYDDRELYLFGCKNRECTEGRYNWIWTWHPALVEGLRCRFCGRRFEFVASESELVREDEERRHSVRYEAAEAAFEEAV